MPPFRFSIPYDRAKLKADGAYSVRARILVDGRVAFTSSEAYPVLTRGAGDNVDMTMQRATTAMEGMFRYIADAATFTDCQSGQRWPVAMEAGYKALESAYSEARRQPGEELKINLRGQLAMRPSAEGGRPELHVIVERHLGIWPGETCGASAPSPPLQETNWRLTRLAGKPVVMGRGLDDPTVIFRPADNRVTGSTGCNNILGTYRLNGSNVRLTSIALTKMVCGQGMDIDATLFTALGKVSKWKINGQHLELSDAENAVVARFEAQPK
jgi:copper homeostasis protein (lipoprotein)